MSRKTIKSLEVQIVNLRELRETDLATIRAQNVSIDRLVKAKADLEAKNSFLSRTCDRLLTIMEFAAQEGNFPRRPA